MKYCLFIFFVFIPNSFANFTQNMGRGIPENSYSIDLNSSYFFTTEKFDSNGKIVPLNSIEKFSKIDSELSIDYGISDDFDLGIGGAFRSNSSTHGSKTLNYNLKSSGIERVFVTTHFYLHSRKSTRYAFEIYLAKTLYNSKDFTTGTIPTDQLVLGDSGADMRFGLFVQHDFSKSFYASLFTKFRIPSNNLSKEIDYNFEISLDPSNRGGFIFRLGFDGVLSLKTDEFSLSPKLKPIQATGLTNLYNSINQSFLFPYGGVNYRFKNFLLTFKGGKIIQGRSTDGGTLVYLGFTYYSKTIYQKFDPDKLFKEYEIEAIVIEVSPRGRFLKIDKGVTSDIEKGMKIDIYSSNHLGDNKLVARGYVYKTGVEDAIIKLTQKYKHLDIKKGFVARGYFVNE